MEISTSLIERLNRTLRASLSPLVRKTGNFCKDREWMRKRVEFLKVWGRIEVDGQDRASLQNDLRTQYQTIKWRIQDHRGYLAEVYMAQILWSGQNKTLPDKFFHSKEDITLPWHFSYVKLRSRLGSSKGM